MDVRWWARVALSGKKPCKVKNKCHVHPSVTHGVVMGTPPPEPSKPHKGRRGKGKTAGHKRKQTEVAAEAGAEVAEATQGDKYGLAQLEQPQAVQNHTGHPGRAPKRPKTTQVQENKKAAGSKRHRTALGTSRKPKKPRHEEMVEKRVEIYWDGMEAWYKGTVAEFPKKRGDFKVECDDGDVHWERLPMQKEGITWHMQKQPNAYLRTRPQPQEAASAIPDVPSNPVMPGKVLVVTVMKADQRQQTILSCQSYGGELREEVTRETTHLVVGGYEANKVTKRTAKVMRGAAMDRCWDAQTWKCQDWSPKLKS